eukprot:scaffold35233_cov59-Cyclotella_meneghiniana.AAC.7
MCSISFKWRGARLERVAPPYRILFALIQHGYNCLNHDKKFCCNTFLGMQAEQQLETNHQASLTPSTTSDKSDKFAHYLSSKNVEDPGAFNETLYLGY